MPMIHLKLWWLLYFIVIVFSWGMQEVIWSIQHFILMIGYGGDGTGISPYFFHEITSFQKLYYDGHLLPNNLISSRLNNEMTSSSLV